MSDDKAAVEPPREVRPGEADLPPSSFEFLPTEDAYGVCDVNGECS